MFSIVGMPCAANETSDRSHCWLEGVPRELDKVTLPAYRVEPPDILSIDCLLQVPDENYRLHEGDTVMLTVWDTFPKNRSRVFFRLKQAESFDSDSATTKFTLLDSPSAKHLRPSMAICESTYASHRSVYRFGKRLEFKESRVNIASARMVRLLSESMDR